MVALKTVRRQRAPETSLSSGPEIRYHDARSGIECLRLLSFERHRHEWPRPRMLARSCDLRRRRNDLRHCHVRERRSFPRCSPWPPQPARMGLPRPLRYVLQPLSSRHIRLARPQSGLRRSCRRHRSDAGHRPRHRRHDRSHCQSRLGHHSHIHAAFCCRRGTNWNAKIRKNTDPGRIE